MTLEETLLRKLSEWHPPAGRQTLTVPDAAAGWAVAVSADRADVLGSLVWEAAVRRSAPAPQGETLTRWADRVAARAVGRERLAPSIEMVAPRIHETTNEHLKFHRLGPELPDPSASKSAHAVRRLDVTMDIN